MQILCEKEDLLKAISTCLGALGTKPTLPILSNVLIQTKEGSGMELIGTDLELGVRTRCKAQVVVEGRITAPARKLYDIVREVELGEIEVTATKNNAVNIKAKKSFFKIMGLEADDFPKLPEPAPEQSFEIDQKTLRECLALTVFAISHDEARYTLNGVLFAVKDKAIRLVATDGKRLASIEKSVQVPADLSIEVIVPTKAVLELIKILSNGTECVRVSRAQNQMVFEAGETTLISRLIEGRFPNYEQVIPKEQKTTTEVNRQELLSAVRRVSLLTSQENQSVKFDFTGGRLLVSSRTPNLGEAKEELDVSISGEELSIGFNPTYLIDVLKNLDTERISISMTDPDKPGLVKNGADYLYVVMPMQLT